MSVLLAIAMEKEVSILSWFPGVGHRGPHLFFCLSLLFVLQGLLRCCWHDWGGGGGDTGREVEADD